MSQTPKKASNRAYKPRSQAGVGMGSRQHIQSLVGLPIGSVQLTKRTVGFCTPRAGGRLHMRAGDAGANRARCRARGGTLSPSPRRPHERALPAIFPPFFVVRGFSMTINQKEYLNGL